jgi:hypothetical protein
MPGVDETSGAARPGRESEAAWAGESGPSARLMILLQFCRGHAILSADPLQMRRQLHGHRTYFLPGGGSRIGVASLQLSHLTTCWSFLVAMSIFDAHTLHATSGPDGVATAVA